MSRSRQLSALLVLFCLVAGACGGDDGTDADRQPTTTAPSTTRSPQEEDEEALRQLAEDWYETSDAIYQHRQEPATAEGFLVDPYLTAYVEQARELVESGRVSEPSERSRLEILEVRVDGDTAVITQCSIDADVLKGPNGEVIDDKVYAQLLETNAVRGEAGWRFNNRRMLSEEEGADECRSA